MRAVYALSADPLTNGHLDIIRRAKILFGEVVIAIGSNPQKNYLFSQSERVALATQALKGVTGVTVTAFSGLLVDFAYEQQIPVIIRGLRTADDYHFENQLFATGLSQQRGIETVCLLATPQHAHVSSSMVKELQLNQGLVQEFVPLVVKVALEKTLSKQVLIGVTGEMGSGKSSLITELISAAKAKNLPAHHLNFDQLAKDVLFEKTEPRYMALRQEINQELGLSYGDKSLQSRQAIANKLFKSPKLQDQLKAKLMTPLLTYLHSQLRDKSGLILIESALFAEWNLFHLVNNRLIVVTTTKSEQTARLSHRKLDPQAIEMRLAAQLPIQEKIQQAKKQIAQSGFGQIWQIESPASLEKITKLSQELSQF